MCQPELVDVNNRHSQLGWIKNPGNPNICEKAFISFDCKNMLCDVRWCGYCKAPSSHNNASHAWWKGVMSETLYAHPKHTSKANTKKLSLRINNFAGFNIKAKPSAKPLYRVAQESDDSTWLWWWQFILLLWLFHIKASFGAHVHTSKVRTPKVPRSTVRTSKLHVLKSKYLLTMKNRISLLSFLSFSIPKKTSSKSPIFCSISGNALQINISSWVLSMCGLSISGQIPFFGRKYNVHSNVILINHTDFEC